MPKLLLAILIGKLIFLATRVLKIGGGSAAPGYYALKVDPNLVEKLAKQIPQNIFITGTNGKTTTARLLAHFLRDSGARVLRNSTGSNLERGIASTLISAYNSSSSSSLSSLGVEDLSGLRAEGLQPTTYNLGIWELDEAAFNVVAPKINPNAVIFLNVFRDQLDRYGEVDIIVKNWGQSVKLLPSDCRIFINGDDAMLEPIVKASKGEVRTFGIKGALFKGEALKKAVVQLDVYADTVKLCGLKGSEFVLNIDGSKKKVTLNLPGTYHIYDTLAALTIAYNLNLDLSKCINSLAHFKPAFGRVEKFDCGYIFLIKNPTGATEVFSTIAPQLKKNDRLLFVLNDNIADGKDVSWIWDANFEQLPAHNSRLTALCSGSRAYDMAVRLKYAGVEPDHITVQPNLEKAFEEAKRGLNGTLYVLPTYTALLQFQKLLTASGKKGHYWNET